MILWSNKFPSFVPDHKFNFRIGNLTIYALDEQEEMFVLTATQTSLTWVPNFTDNTYKINLKVEGFILEAASETNKLITVMASEHLSTSPAYFLRAHFDKNPCDSKATHKLKVTMDSVEMLYNEVSSETFFWASMNTDDYS